jgi:predicted nucleotidyltransferase
MTTVAQSSPPLELPREALADFCRRNGIQSLALFGSFLHGNARPGSDIDLLVSYEPQHRVGLFDMARMALELSDIVGYPVDLRTAQDLSAYFRDRVVAEARYLYDS